MELRMRYATAEDGVTIAYAVAGSGPPLVRMPALPFSHCQLEWRESEFFERLAGIATVVAYDSRGTGLSDRDVADVSLEARVADLKAVVDAASFDRFALWSVNFSTATAVTFATRYPDRVSHLILDDALARPADLRGTAVYETVMAVRGNWDEFIWQMAWSVKQGSREETRRYADFLKACVDEGIAARLFEELDKEDVTDLLPRAAVPTLVITHMEARTIPAHHGRALAAAIPGAEFLGLQGIVTDETDQILTAAARFIGSSAGVESQPSQRGGAGGFCTILWTDLVNHSAMMHQLGDSAGRELLREHERITRALLAQYGGSEVKTMGDGFLVSFGRATAAVECAIALQRAFAERNERAATEHQLQVRVGLNAGEPIEDEGDLFGATVILASRIASQAGPGDILVPEPVRHIVAGKGFVFSDRGEFVPKGFDDAVHLFEVRWGD